MSVQQIHPRFRPASTHAATHLPTLTGAFRIRPRTRWMTDEDHVELARGGSFSTSRDGSNDIRSVANVQNLSSLQEIFSGVAVDVIADVLVAAQFRMDIAASMLGDLSRESLDSSHAESPEHIDGDWAAIEGDADDDADEWHDISASRPEMQQWVLVQDEWEVVEGNSMNQGSVRSYADVLRSSGSRSKDASRIQRLPQLVHVQPTTSTSPLARTKSLHEDAEELCGKSFGARKRRFMRKHRG